MALDRAQEAAGATTRALRRVFTNRRELAGRCPLGALARLVASFNPRNNSL
jgi:hypothetical protein